MLIDDGVSPGNERRGYVLRRLLRRTVRSMRLLGVEDPVLPELLPISRDAMAPSYPELVDRLRPHLVRWRTPRRRPSGRPCAPAPRSSTPRSRRPRPRAARALSGERAFPLHDTYGFPIDLTLEMAAEQGLAVDEHGFRRLMPEQRERAKADSRAKKIGHVDLSAYREVLDAGGATDFTGYDEVVSEARVRRRARRRRRRARRPARATTSSSSSTARPFYAEGGGQLADQGVIRLGNGAEVEVHDVQTPLPGVVVHRGTVTSGEVVRDDTVTGEVDVERRRAISRAHTATHLVHKAFRQTLGETATQAGSENAPGRFRFDFASPVGGARRRCCATSSRRSTRCSPPTSTCAPR